MTISTHEVRADWRNSDFSNPHSYTEILSDDEVVEVDTASLQLATRIDQQGVAVLHRRPGAGGHR